MKKIVLSTLLFLFYTSLTIAQGDLSNYTLSELKQFFKKAPTSAAKLTYALAMQDKANQTLNQQDTTYTNVLTLLGDAYNLNGNYEQAEKVYLQALEIQALVIGKQDPAYATTLLKLGTSYNKLEDFETSYAYYLQASKIKKKIFGENHPVYASALQNLGLNAYHQGDYETAEEIYFEALEIYQSTPEDSTQTYATLLDNLGVLYHELGEYDLAEEYIQQGRSRRAKVLGKQHILYAISLNHLGNLYSELGNYKDAESLYLEALAINEKIFGSQHSLYLSALTDLIYLYQDVGDLSKAEFYALQVFETSKNVLGEDHPDYAMTLNDLSYIYMELGEYQKAEFYGLQGLEICKEVLGEDHPDYSYLLNSLGILYMDLGSYKKSERYLLKALQLDEKTYGKKHPDYAIALNNLATLYQESEEYQKAKEYIQQTLEIEKEILGERHPNYAFSLRSMGTLYYKSKEYQKAQDYFLQASSIYKTVLGEQHHESIRTLNYLGQLYLTMENYTKTQEHIILAVNANSGIDLQEDLSNLTVDQFSSVHYITWEQMIESLLLAYDILEQKQTRKAKQQQALLADLALKILENSKNELSDDTDKLRILKNKSEWILQSMRVLDLEKDKIKAFSLVEQEKGGLLLDASTNEQVYTQGLLPDSLIQEEIELKEAYAETKAALSERRKRTEADSLLNELNNLNTEITLFEKKIKEKYPKYATMRFKHDDLNAQDVQKLLPKNTAMIEYLIGDSVVYIFYLDKQQVNVHKWEVSKETLNSYVHRLHRTLGDYDLIRKDPQASYERYTQTAHWLYQHLLAPVLSKSTKINKLIIIPDGDLGHLPFGTFLVEAAQNEQSYNDLHYLIQDYDISYNYAASLWKKNITAKRKKNNGKILGVAANYDIKFDTTQTHQRLPVETRLRQVLSPLPAASLEVQHLEEFYKGFYAFDTLASEQTFKDQAGQYAVIHLAAHGIFNSRDQALSSLVLTEDSDSNQNNFLHAYEIARMNLNADLVVLSACETGFGKFEEGNGIASLARSFMYSGVSAMTVSLWKVNDGSTKELMNLFYTYLAQGKNKDTALRQAKLDYLQMANDIAAHPAYWSTFIMIGNNSPVTIKQKGSGKYAWLWWSGIGLVGLLVLGIGYKKMKPS